MLRVLPGSAPTRDWTLRRHPCPDWGDHPCAPDYCACSSHPSQHHRHQQQHRHQHRTSISISISISIGISISISSIGSISISSRILHSIAVGIRLSSPQPSPAAVSHRLWRYHPHNSPRPPLRRLSLPLYFTPCPCEKKKEKKREKKKRKTGFIKKECSTYPQNR